MIKNKWFWIGIAILIVCIAASYTYGKKNPSQDILNNFVKQYQEEIDRQTIVIKEKEEAIKLSEEKYQIVLKKLKAAQQIIIKPPVTNAEMRRRYAEAGFAPISK